MTLSVGATLQTIVHLSVPIMSGMEARRIFKLIGGNIFPRCAADKPIFGQKDQKVHGHTGPTHFHMVQQHIVTDCRLHRRC